MRPFGRAELRRLSLGLATLLMRRPRGFFIPHRYADRLPRAGERGPYDAIEDRFSSRRAAFEEGLALIDRHAGELAALGGPPPRPRWDQDWFPCLDAAFAYALVRERAPARVVEVGSGHSTRFVVEAARAGGHDIQFTAIDPSPRADIAALEIDCVRQPVQHVGPEIFAALEAGDVLFIDSSHVLMPGTDVDLLLNRVLPNLPAGVLVHVHDMFLPDDYPAEWDWRGYNEQLGVAPLILGGAVEVIWSSRYVRSRLRHAVDASAAGQLPLVSGAYESSLWFTTRGFNGGDADRPRPGARHPGS